MFTLKMLLIRVSSGLAVVLTTPHLRHNAAALHNVNEKRCIRLYIVAQFRFSYTKPSVLAENLDILRAQRALSVMIQRK